ncbi:hypothetical protein BV22DRAFT_967311, partial [Leucogyrophana mollusca]
RTGTSARGRSVARGRGGSTAARRRRAQPPPGDADNEQETRTGQFDEDAEDVTESRGKLKSKEAKEARAELKRLVTNKFRRVCDVAEGTKWPTTLDERKNDITDEVYLTPKFSTTVNDEHNRVIFAKIAHLVWQDLQAYEKLTAPQTTALSDCLVNRKVKWNKQTLFTFAKETYRGFKDEYRAQTDAEKKAVKENNQRTNRWAQRRKEKADRLMSARQTYLKKHGADPTDIIHADHMSDEASGPEDDEPEDTWKRRMADKMGMPVGMLLDNLIFLEVTNSPWRANELGDVFHELRRLWWDSMEPKQRKRFNAMRVEGTGRESLRIPEFTPYDFGINAEWFTANNEKIEIRDLLKGWGAWGDPEGF